MLWQVREIYETAIEAEPPYGVSDEDCKRLCLQYAKLEQKLGEIDRCSSSPCACSPASAFSLLLQFAGILEDCSALLQSEQPLAEA